MPPSSTVNRSRPRKKEARGYDGGKKIKGRKRHVLVDTTGLILHVLVHEANIQDYRGGKLLLAPLKEAFPRLKLIWAESGYKKEGFCEWGKRNAGLGGRDCGTSLERPARGLGPKGCGDRLGEDPTEWLRMCFLMAGLSSAPSPGSRAFRRLSKDDEVLKGSEEAWIYIAMIRIMLRRLAQNSS